MVKIKVELRRFNIIDYFKFLRLTLNKQDSKELDKSFFGYLFKGLKSLFRREKNYKFAILINKKFAGSIALYKENEDYELGYFILRNFRGRGIATKASKKILNFGFKQLKLNKIIANTDLDNKASQKILKKLGFKIIKENKKEKELLWEKKSK